MRLNDLLKGSVDFHKTLNPKLWNGTELRKDVHRALMNIAEAFQDFLAVDGLHVEDVILTGSNAAFNYTAGSDVDVHLIVDFEKSVCPKLADNFFQTKKSLWNETHEITVKGLPVELYVEDTAEPVTAQGVYSLKQSKWLSEPKRKEPKIDDRAVILKVDALAHDIDKVLDSHPDNKKVSALMKRLKTMRQSGLDKGGEFSVENIAFKVLRSKGYVKKIADARQRTQDDELSLESKEAPAG
jgi:predicted nucleotidyltransferase